MKVVPQVRLGRWLSLSGVCVQELHPLAPHVLPHFIAAPGEVDRLTVIVTIGITTTIMLVGVLFFWLHSLPERLAHKSHKLQIELIAVLGLLSLFTHIHIFWVAALILAFVKIPEIPVPDVMGSLDRIANSIDRTAPRARYRRQRRNAAPALISDPGAGGEKQRM